MLISRGGIFQSAERFPVFASENRNDSSPPATFSKQYISDWFSPSKTNILESTVHKKNENVCILKNVETE